MKFGKLLYGEARRGPKPVRYATKESVIASMLVLV
jgi:hypothetical protein